MKKIIFTFALAAMSFFTHAQEYYHGLGLSYLYYIGSTSYDAPGLTYDGVNVGGVPGITYKATLAFEAGKQSYFAISSYPTLGISFSSGGGSNSLGYQLPLLAEFYTSSPDEPGFVGGAGFSYGFAASDSFDSFGPSGGSVFGPMLSAGGQFDVKDKLIGVRGAYTYGLNKIKGLPAETTVIRDSKSMITLGVYYVFGY